MQGDGGDNDEPPLLSQLIYSQSSLHNNGNGSLPVVAAGIKAEQQQSVDEFYGLERDKTTTAVGYVPAERLMRRARSRKRGPEQFLESQEQADERQRKKLIHIQLAHTQNKWKQRKVDVRKEVDEGGVFELLVRKHWKRRRTDAVFLSQEPLETYWEQGLVAPRPIPGIPTPSHIPIQKQTLPPAPKLNHSFPMGKAEMRTTTEVKHMVQRQHLLNCPVSGVHFHQGAVAKVIARSLISGTCTSEGEQNIFLGTLYKVNPNLRSEAILREAYHHGLNFQIFQRLLWSDRSAAAEQLLTIDTRKNRSTSRRIVINYEDAHRNKVITKLSASNIVVDVQGDDMQEVGSVDTAEGSDDVNENSEDSDEDSEVGEDKGVEDDERIEAHESEAFRFLSGAVPPKPEYPVDICNVEFGAKDPYCHAVRMCRIKPAAAELILATLLTRIAAADRENLMEAHTTVSLFLEFLLRRNKLCKTIIINKYNKGVDMDVPAVAEYHACIQYCRYAANHRIFIGGETNYDTSEANDVRNANKIADEMSLVLEEIQTRPGIKSFPRIHLIYAMCIIARDLPTEAANIFARGDHETPFHAVRLTLEFLEGNKMLTENAKNVTPFRNILAGILEHVFNEAAKIVEMSCMTVSEEIDYHAWLVALRLSSVLLCSGVKIGGPVVRHASHKKKGVNVESYFSQDSQPEHLPHEVRQRLPKFEETRIQAAEELQRFLQSAVKQEGSRTSGMIVTALEWSQPIALIVGPGKSRGMAGPERVWSHIRASHSRHMLKVAPLTPHQLKELKNRDTVNSNAITNKLALNLENDPSDTRNWRRLVRELGPLGGTSKKCHKCSECKFLRKGFFVDHAGRQERSWWGRERRSWWKLHLLTLPPTPECEPQVVFTIGQQVEQKLQLEELPISTSRETDATLKASHAWLNRIVIKLKKQQLHAKEPAKQTAASIPSVDSRKTEVDDLLPHPVPKEYESVSSECISSCIPGLDDNEVLEVLSYKIFLTAQLYGANDPAVAHGVWFLARRHFGSKDKIRRDESWLTSRLPPTTPNDDWKCIVWLASQGLFVCQSLLSYYKEVMSPAPEDVAMQGSDYSDEIKEAMRLGVQCFGTKSLFTIRDNVPFFNSWDRKRLRSLYNAMTAHGEL